LILIDISQQQAHSMWDMTFTAAVRLEWNILSTAVVNSMCLMFLQCGWG